MEIRGDRECTDCGERWSYYDTGEIRCPACGSIRSVGVGDRAEHTASPVAFDLSPVRADIDAEPLADLADRASDRAAEYVRQAGFVDAGRLRPLDDSYLAAAELRRVGARLARALRIDDEQERYFFELLGADSGERPAPDAVPASLRAERGRAVAAATDAYTSDLRRAYGDPERPVASVLSAARARRKRIEALDGDVDPAEAERLVSALRELFAYLADGDEVALARAEERLSGDGSG